jgi:serine/threonine protein kinase
VASSDFTLVRQIGDGSFSNVYLGKYCETTVAVKMLTQHNAPSATATLQQRTALANLQKEAGLMAKLRHPNVCQYLGACRDPPCLIMEYCSKRSLDQLLSAGLANPKGATAKQLNWGRLLNMALDAAKGEAGPAVLRVLTLHGRKQGNGEMQ